MPTRSAMTVSSGSISPVASRRGETSLCVASVPSARMASMCSVTVSDPSSLTSAEEVRRATISAVKGLTDIPGIRVGHTSDFEAITGCTAILCDQAMGGVDIRGSATGTQEIDTLSPFHITDQVHGILLAGGSAFGLEAAAGVRR